MAVDYLCFNLQFFGMFLSFIISLKLIKNKNIPRYMNGFYWYSVVGFLFALPVFFEEYFFKSLKCSTYITNFSLLFHYSFLGSFILKVMPIKKDKSLLKFLYFLIFCFILFFICTKDNSLRNHKAYALTNFSLIIFCTIYYFQLFKNIPTLNLLTEPSFWIISGVFFCMSISIPTTGIMDYLKYNATLMFHRNINALTMLSYFIMHLFFIKAYLCAINPLKV